MNFTTPSLTDVVQYYSGTQDRVLIPSSIDANFRAIGSFSWNVYQQLQMIESKAIAQEQQFAKLQSFMTWLAEQHPEVLDEFTNTVDVAKKLDAHPQTETQL